jgi:ornithine cyclodeaminase/alanine dehydrogenase-like protein (mu-crystallin family)
MNVKNKEGEFAAMKYIDFNTITELGISPEKCIAWAKEALLAKSNSILPPKVSIKFSDGCFFNTMPSLLPEIERFGVKIVSRYTGTFHCSGHGPSLSGDIMLYDSATGRLLSIMDGTWITTMRTGAVAALSINLLSKRDIKSYSFIGLGNTARAVLLCLNAALNCKHIIIKILAYKNQHEVFMQRFAPYTNITFKVYDSVSKLIRSSDVIISCVTIAKENFADNADYPEGVLVIPIHTMGFQNCDLFFDKIFCDDIGHIKNFKYFSLFKNCDEVSNILTGKKSGRESENERILVYNIGISLQDIFFASNIYELAINHPDVMSLTKPQISAFWV